MAKAQKRSSKEIRKPKATKVKASVGIAADVSPVNTLMKKPKAKL
jgi:hypothetical protein